MHIKLNNGAVEKYPYSFTELKKDNPQTSFPQNPSAELLAEFGMLPVEAVEKPQYDYTKNVTEGTPTLQNGKWVQTWVVVNLTAEEIAEVKEQNNAEIKEKRKLAYQQESDPVFFKAQRGEATNQDWLDTIASIDARFPYQE